MQTRLLFFVALTASCAHHEPVITGTANERAANLDFEAGAGDTGFPTGWAGGGDAYTFAVDPTVAHGGHASARLAHVPGDYRATWASLTQCVAPTPWLGQRLRVRAQLRTDAVSAAGLWMRVDHAEGTAAFDNMADRFRTGTTDWSEAADVLDVPADATRICFGLLVQGEGTAWIDDVAFDRVGPEVASTALVPSVRTAPTNLDFEGGGAALPVAWSGGGQGYALAAEAVPGHPGAAGRVRWLGRGKPRRRDFGTLTQCVPADPWRGHRLRYGGVHSTQDASGHGAGLWLRVDGPDARVLAFDNMWARAVTGSTDWAPAAIVADVPAEAERVCFGMLLSGAGTAWVDDLRFDVVGDDVAVTTD